VTDDILGVIERSRKPELAASQAILKRIRRRELYRFLSENILLDPEIVKQYVSSLDSHLYQITPEEIVGH
jgi:hypothetical protein